MAYCEQYVLFCHSQAINFMLKRLRIVLQHVMQNVSSIQDSVEDKSDGIAVPRHQNWRMCNEEALQLSLGSRSYLET